MFGSITKSARYTENKDTMCFKGDSSDNLKTAAEIAAAKGRGFATSQNATGPQGHLA